MFPQLRRVTPLGGALALALPAVSLAAAPQALAQDALPAQCSPDGEQVVCEYTAPGATTWTVPGGVTEAIFEVHGAQGGGAPGAAGGLGGSATATVHLESGETVRLTVGGHGIDGGRDGVSSEFGGDGGFNGGAPGGDGSGNWSGAGGGGGASDVRLSPYGLDDRIIVAGGGGGAALGQPGGDGGGDNGEAGRPEPPIGGGGGTQDDGGAGGNPANLGPTGSDGAKRDGGAGASFDIFGTPDGHGGGGGGGGYYGGGGGAAEKEAADVPTPLSGGGGGGSGYIHPDTTDASFGEASETGDGRILITYTPPDTTPPVLSGLSDWTVTATSAEGATVDYEVPVATDDTDPDPMVSCDQPSGSVLPPGTTTISCMATDDAGNTATDSVDVTVAFDLSGGLLRPVDPTAVNTMKGGRTVPLKWQVPTPDGGFISDPAIVADFQVLGLDCATSRLGAPVEATTTGATRLRYDQGAEQFVQNWKTPRTPDECYRASIVFVGGQTLSADFHLR